MDRIKLLKEMQQLQNKKERLVALKSDIRNQYFESGLLTVSVKTAAYSRSYQGEAIEIAEKLFEVYLDKEINAAEEEFEKLLSKLK